MTELVKSMSTTAKWLSIAVIVLMAGAAGYAFRSHGAAAFSERVPLDKQVVVSPGDNVAKVVEDHPSGTMFVFEPGVYRGNVIVPKDRQQFFGTGEVIISGAAIVDKWRREGDHWIAAGLPNPLRPHGDCNEGYETCKFREDLFLNDRLFHRVASLDKLVAGTWYYEANQAFIVDDPQGAKIELSYLPVAFTGRSTDVRLENLIVEKYASQAQSGAIDGKRSERWIVSNVSARWNHGLGLFIGKEMRVSGGSYSNNGQMGMAGSGDNAVIEGVEIAYNNYANFAYGWEAGGFKFDNSRDLVVRNSCIHNNNGVGMWNDIDNIDTIFEGNRVFRNARVGIANEISYAMVIRNNIVAQNATDRDGWLWGAQILVLNSQDTEVYGNVVEVAAGYGNGITIIHQKRGTGEYGEYLSQNNYIHNNRIIHLGNRGRNGMIADYQEKWFDTDSNNRFDRNTYVIPNPDLAGFAILDGFRTWKVFQENGMEPNGQLIVKQAQPMKLTCRS